MFGRIESGASEKTSSIISTRRNAWNVIATRCYYRGSCSEWRNSIVDISPREFPPNCTKNLTNRFPRSREYNFSPHGSSSTAKNSSRGARYPIRCSFNFHFPVQERNVEPDPRILFRSTNFGSDRSLCKRERASGQRTMLPRSKFERAIRLPAQRVLRYERLRNRE